MTGPRLSVVVPAFNRQRTLAATLASVAGCGEPAEVIVVDDGSADATAAVAAAAGAVVVRQANAGPSAARNTGLGRATGRYVAFLDSDDAWTPGVVPELLDLLDERPGLDAAFCDARVGDPEAGYKPFSELAGQGRFGDLLTDPVGPDLFRLDRATFLPALLDRNLIFLGSLVVRREVAAVLPPFDPAMRHAEDYLFLMRLAASSRLGFFARTLTTYEKHPAGLSADGDRMAHGFVRAMTAFLAGRPPLTPVEARAARRMLARSWLGYTYRAYDRGDIGEARRRALAGLRAGGASVRLAALAAACCLPAGVVRRLRAAKQAAGRDGG